MAREFQGCCQVCGSHYVFKRRTSRFCSAACRQKFFRLKREEARLVRRLAQVRVALAPALPAWRDTELRSA